MAGANEGLSCSLKLSLNSHLWPVAMSLDSAALLTRVPGAVLGAGEFRMRPLEFTARWGRHILGHFTNKRKIAFLTWAVIEGRAVL